jgi:hypothetical protein
MCRENLTREAISAVFPFHTAALKPTPSVRAARTCTTRAIGVFKSAIGGFFVSEKVLPQEEQ